jgi:hypothetical protein
VRQKSRRERPLLPGAADENGSDSPGVLLRSFWAL